MRVGGRKVREGERVERDRCRKKDGNRAKTVEKKRWKSRSEKRLQWERVRDRILSKQAP